MAKPIAGKTMSVTRASVNMRRRGFRETLVFRY
jgi:hypothetical protein